MKEKVEIDALVVGGGIIGLFTAYWISKDRPELNIALIEEEVFCGHHTTGRNSGVMHSGIYYKQDSLKHRLCMQGLSLWREFCQENSIELINCGKYIIAVDDYEKEALINLKNRAAENNVGRVEYITRSSLKELQNITHASEALFVPQTGVLDTTKAIFVLNEILFKRNVPVLKCNKALNIKKSDDTFLIETQNEIIETSTLINCAGLKSVNIREKLGLTDIESKFVKGHYYRLKKEFNFKSLIYPPPLKELKGLGIHITFDVNGVYRFGPDTIDVADSPNNLIYTEEPGRLEEILPNIQKYFKNISKADLEFDYCGIRPKIKKAGALYQDFQINCHKFGKKLKYVETLGIESPGLTAAPAISLSAWHLISNKN